MPTDPTDLWFDPTIDLDKLSPAERRQLTRLQRIPVIVGHNLHA
jgi:hypothetical protein